MIWSELAASNHDAADICCPDPFSKKQSIEIAASSSGGNFGGSRESSFGGNFENSLEDIVGDSLGDIAGDTLGRSLGDIVGEQETEAPFSD